MIDRKNGLISWYYLDNAKTDIGQDPDRFISRFLDLWLDPLNWKRGETLEPISMLSWSLDKKLNIKNIYKQ